jgi:predicted SAM-dependent methyltransferase
MPDLTFVIYEKDVDLGRKWLAEHPCKHRNLKYKGAIGGGVTWSFTNTSIGQIQTINCSCGESKMVNDDL